jgi:lysophospholipase L1-like esterase
LSFRHPAGTGGRAVPPAERAPGAAGRALALLLLAVFSTVAGLLLVEAGFRLADRVRCFDDSSGTFWEPHPLYGWRHTPNAVGWAKRCLGGRVEWRTWVRINRRGLRGPDVPYQRGEAFRVLLLGDSYTEAVQVPLEATFAARLEGRLNARPGARRVEVVNGGHAGFGTDNELLFYRHEGRRYRPDLVLLVFNTENDVFENYWPLRRHARLYADKPHFRFEDGRLALRNFPLPVPSGPRAWPDAARRSLFRHSMTYRFVRRLGGPQVVRRAEAAAPPSEAAQLPAEAAALGPLGALLQEEPAAWREGWRVTRSLVRALQREVRRDGAAFGIVVISGGYEVSEQRLRARAALLRVPRALFVRDRSHRRAMRFVRRRGVPHTDLLPVFRRRLEESGRDGYYRWDPHWNADGHAFAAEHLAPWLEASGLVPLLPPAAAD